MNCGSFHQRLRNIVVTSLNSSHVCLDSGGGGIEMKNQRNQSFFLSGKTSRRGRS